MSFLKAPGFQDGHAGDSDPLDEQQFIVNEINAPEHTPDWSSTVVVFSYDDSDGWYDHVFSGVTNASASVQDFLTGTGVCGNPTANPPLAAQNGRCGYGPRLPLMVISPWARRNSVAHNLRYERGSCHSSVAGSRVSETELMHHRWSVGTA